MSLLDPVAFKSYLTFVLQLPSVDGKPGFESSNGVDLFTGSLFGAWYAQNIHRCYLRVPLLCFQ